MLAHQTAEYLPLANGGNRIRDKQATFNDFSTEKNGASSIQSSNFFNLTDHIVKQF